MQAIADDPEGSVVRAVINSLINMEGSKPKSCDALLKQLLQRLARFAFYSSSLEKPKKKSICMSFSCGAVQRKIH